jgi:gas vesicle protein
MSPDSLAQCANASGIFYVGALAGAIVGAVAVLLWRSRK